MKEDKNFVRPFIRWAGGKQNLVKYLLANAPKDGTYNKYWEPFLGAGSLFFANGFTNAEISDINPHLINAYNQIKERPNAVSKRLSFYAKNISREYYYEVREQYNKHLEESTIEQAVRFIFLVHTSFNGFYRVNGRGEYNVPFGKLKPSIPPIDHLNAVSKKLKNVRIKFQPYDAIIKSVKKKDFIYLDPPYPKIDEKDLFQQFTIDKFSQDHQNDLADFANELKKKGCYVMISNSKVPLIEKLYSDWNITEVPAIRYINCKKERIQVNELIIKNY